MGEIEIKSTQSNISRKLHGAMGKDMIDILDGRKKIEIPKSSKFKRFISRILMKINGNEKEF